MERGLKCFAYQQYTASVIHMMRVAEQGLRAGAREWRVTLPKGRPIEELEAFTLESLLNVRNITYQPLLVS